MEKNSKNLHPRNKFNQEYDFKKLIKHVHQLKKHIVVLPDGRQSLDFRDPESVFLLNKALLESEYKVNNWDLLNGSLCPSIPGRLNYIHYLADLIQPKNPKKVNVLDIGTGSSLIYPILGFLEYHWNFVASDTHIPSIQHAHKILNDNPYLKKGIKIRQQENSDHILKGIIQPNEYFEAILCNPPFYKSREDYRQTVLKKNQKLHQETESTKTNFQGLSNELWFPGGEKKFISNMIYESFDLRDQIGLCSVLVSDKDNLKPLKAILEYHKTEDVKVTQMNQGNKINRILSWRLNK
ncbi:23S rRNA (adenine(1618)-N(6))-methyltransferase RlmF [Sphingobacterium mizutaii]|uniref:23S rRNA (adenine(1618)-N(6))-methyltransferase RlmF n=1 Tax=Sphingobacterium mizutaii TaxID=1010 RepID=UPI0028A0E661|nr:23S rRNA (adenine(1618)-N(6))-methyltransferase RlmF [Sphingobacterium mizutaii]